MTCPGAKPLMLLIMLTAASGSTPLGAGTTVHGDVSPWPPTGGTLVIGGNGYGRLTMSDNALLQSNHVVLGAGPAGVGEADLSGAGTYWSTLSMTIGGAGQGSVRVADDAVLEIINSPVLIGADRTAVAELVVDGAAFIAREGVAVGYEGYGAAHFSNGASVVMENGFHLGEATLGYGVMTAEGAGTVVTTGYSNLTIGQGELHIRDGALFNAISSTLEGAGDIHLGDGVFRIDRIDQFNGGFQGDGAVFIADSGPVFNNGAYHAGQGETLRITTNEIRNQGRIEAIGGEVHIDAALQNLGPPTGLINGVIQLHNGDLRVTPQQPTPASHLENYGDLLATGGENNLYGRVRNQLEGEIVVANNSTLLVHDPLESDGQITVMPGSRAVFLGGLQMNEGTLLANIAGTDDDTGYGVVEVSGSATLNGQIALGAGEGFTPREGDRYTLLTASKGILGAPSLAMTPGLPGGLEWSLEVAGAQLAAVVVGNPYGDYNQDGAVNTLDYAFWREGYEAGIYAADGYLRINANYGAEGLGVAPTPAPTPASCVLLAAGVALAPWRRRRG